MSLRSKPSVDQYLQDTFGTEAPPKEFLIDDIACFIDASIVQPAHVYLTNLNLCFHIHGQKGKEKKIPWSQITSISKRNTAKIIPNAILVGTKEGGEFWFSFLYRHFIFKIMEKVWMGKLEEIKYTNSHNSPHFVHPSASPLASSPLPAPDSKKLKRRKSEIYDEVIETNKQVEIESRYSFHKELGKGAFSVVKLATHKETGVKRAIKVIDKNAVGREKKEMLDREVDILKRIRHPHIISVMEIYESKTHLFLVMELAEGGELFDAIIKRGKYSERDAAIIVKQITEAIGYLHSKGIVHRDLKPENLLLTTKASKHIDIKIADFGLSKVMEETNLLLKTACGTPGYVAPEVLTGNGYNQAVDLWSIGVIMYILLCGFPPFYGENNNKLFDKIIHARYTFPSPYWSKVSENAKDLIRNLLVVSPKKRLTAHQTLKHNWLIEHGQDTDLMDAVFQLRKSLADMPKESNDTSSSVARMAIPHLEES